MNLTMAGTIRRAFVLGALACALVAGVSSAHAAPPNSGPGEIKTYGFEGSASDSFAETVATPNYLIGEIDTTEYWGRTTQESFAGTGALWCAGTSAAAWPYYSPGTRGEARTQFDELAEYYSSSVSLKYKMRYEADSVFMGTSDYFRLLVRENVGSTFQSYLIEEPANSSWATYSYDLSGASSYPRLSRMPATLSLVFRDYTEDSFAGVDTTGTGPLVDDFKLVGYKYGPVTSVAATSPAPGQVDLTWAKPKRAIGSAVDEERTVAYRIYRALWGTEAWEEVTTEGTRPTSRAFTDTTALPGTRYKYVVQAWDTGAGDGRGIQSAPVDLALELPTAVLGAPQRISSSTVYPWSNFTMKGTVDITHTADAPVTVEFSQGGQVKKTVAAVVPAGATTYSFLVSGLPAGGTWSVRAVHEDATHQRSVSSIGTFKVAYVKLNAPAPRSTMLVNHTYTVYGTLMPKHSSGTYTKAMRVNAYKYDSKQKKYLFKTSFSVTVSNPAGMAANTSKYSAKVKLTSKGTYMLKLKHAPHGADTATTYSAYSSKITVK